MGSVAGLPTPLRAVHAAIGTPDDPYPPRSYAQPGRAGWASHSPGHGGIVTPIADGAWSPTTT